MLILDEVKTLKGNLSATFGIYSRCLDNYGNWAWKRTAALKRS